MLRPLLVHGALFLVRVSDRPGSVFSNSRATDVVADGRSQAVNHVLSIPSESVGASTNNETWAFACRTFDNTVGVQSVPSEPAGSSNSSASLADSHMANNIVHSKRVKVDSLLALPLDEVRRVAKGMR